MNSYKLVEGHRRFMQILYGSKLFTCPGLYSIRRLRYSQCFKMGDACRIGYGVTLHREHGHSEGTIKVGNNVLLADNVKIDYSGAVVIQDYVWISDSVHIHTHIHPVSSSKRCTNDSFSETTSVLICEGAWIGDSSIILPSCHYIGRNSIVGAGSVVTKDIPDDSVYAGNPAVFVRRINEEDGI